jgi:hypothetical protein
LLGLLLLGSGGNESAWVVPKHFLDSLFYFEGGPMFCERCGKATRVTETRSGEDREDGALLASRDGKRTLKLRRRVCASMHVQWSVERWTSEKVMVHGHTKKEEKR